LIRDYRLTLDYQEDINLFRIIEEYFKRNHIDFNLKRLFEYLDNNPAIANINKDCQTKYLNDKELIDLLNKVTRIGGVGDKG